MNLVATFSAFLLLFIHSYILLHSFLISSKYLKDRVLMTFLTAISSVVLLGWCISLLNILIKVSITRTNTLLILLLSTAASLYFLKRQTGKLLPEKIYLDRNLLILFFISIVSMGGLHFAKPMMIDPDSLIYLHRLSHIVGTGVNPINYDRNIVHNFGAILSFISLSEPLEALKLMASVIFGITGLAIGVLTSEIAGKKNLYTGFIVGLLFSVIIRTTQHMFAQSLAISVVALSIILTLKIAEEKKPSKILIIFLFLSIASIFSLHGLIAFAQIPLLSLPILFLMYKNHKHIKVKKLLANIALASILFFVITQPFIGIASSYVKQAALQYFELLTTSDSRIINEPIHKNSNETVPESTVATPSQPIQETSFLGIKRIIDLYHPIVALLMGFSCLILIYEARWNRKNRLKYTFILVIMSLLLTLSNLPEINQSVALFLSRVTYLSYILFIPILIFGITRLIDLIPLQKKLQPLLIFVCMLIVIVPELIRSYEVLRNYNDPRVYTRETHDFFNSIKDYVEPNVNIYNVSGIYMLGLGLNPNLQFIDASPIYLCNNFDYTDEDLTVFNGNTESLRAYEILSIKIKNNYFFLIDDLENNCINRETLEGLKYEVVNEAEQRHRLLKVMTSDIPS